MAPKSFVGFQELDLNVSAMDRDVVTFISGYCDDFC
jgi:hypothetical protein